MKKKEQIYVYQGGKRGGNWEGEELRGWDWHIYTIDTVYKIDN